MARYSRNNESFFIEIYCQKHEMLVSKTHLKTGQSIELHDCKSYDTMRAIRREYIETYGPLTWTVYHTLGAYLTETKREIKRLSKSILKASMTGKTVNAHDVVTWDILTRLLPTIEKAKKAGY